MILREALTDSAFFDHFKDADSLEAHWPLRPNPNAERRRKGRKKGGA